MNMPAQYTNKPEKYFAGYQGTLFKQYKKKNNIYALCLWRLL